MSDEKFWEKVSNDYYASEYEDELEYASYDDTSPLEILEELDPSENQDHEIFEECVDSIVMKIQVGHMTLDTGVSSIVKMGYSEDVVREALESELGVTVEIGK